MAVDGSDTLDKYVDGTLVERDTMSGKILYGAFSKREMSADPSNPDEGYHVIWQSDGTGSGDDGDIMIKIKAGGVTKTITLVDFSTF